MMWILLYHHQRINALFKPIPNLITNSTSYFFNTLSDPYENAISDGIWLNAPDYDAPTQLLKVNEHNTRYPLGLIDCIKKTKQLAVRVEVKLNVSQSILQQRRFCFWMRHNHYDKSLY